MKTKFIFVISVVVIALVLILVKQVTLAQILQYKIEIGASLLAVYAWLSKEDIKKENTTLKMENANQQSEIETLTSLDKANFRKTV